MRTMAQIRGVHGYLDGTITRSNTPTAKPKDRTAIAETSWNSKKPSLDE